MTVITNAYKVVFERKVRILRSQSFMEIGDDSIEIFIDRENFFNNAFLEIMSIFPKNLKDKLLIRYVGEEDIENCGGFLRDFFYNISKEIGNPNYALFQYLNNNSYELVINPIFGLVEPNYLEYYKFVGRIMGLAILHKQFLNINFSLAFYKRVLEKPLSFSDLEYVDPDLYKRLSYIKENIITEDFGLVFTTELEDCFGKEKIVELKTNGANIKVTESNKDEFIDLLVKYKLNNRNDEKQFNAIKQGFYEIIPRNLNSLFNERDLKYLLVGMNEIDVDDWENNTDYEGYTKNDITIINFWKCARELDNENRKKLLIFATGNSQVPVTGFKDLRGGSGIEHFKIKKLYQNSDLLPSSQIYYNCIQLPPYTSYTKLKQNLLFIITEE